MGEGKLCDRKTLPVDCGEVTLVERPLGLVEARSPDLRGGSHGRIKKLPRSRRWQ